VGAGAISVVLVDVDGDGRLDIAVSNGTSASVSILHNEGSGLFSPSVESPVGTYLGGIAAGDLDGDGKPELVVANLDNTGLGIADVRVLANDGQGNFGTSAGRFIAMGGANLSAVAMADLDGDHRLDVIATGGDEGTVTVLRGDGRGGLSAAVP